MIELTEQQQQQQALQTPMEIPPRVVNPRTQETYVLLREDWYQQIRDLFGGDQLSAEERSVILEGVWRRAGWDEPAMDAYDAL